MRSSRISICSASHRPPCPKFRRASRNKLSCKRRGRSFRSRQIMHEANSLHSQEWPSHREYILVHLHPCSGRLPHRQQPSATIGFTCASRLLLTMIFRRDRLFLELPSIKSHSTRCPSTEQNSSTWSPPPLLSVQNDTFPMRENEQRSRVYRCQYLKVVLPTECMDERLRS